MMVTTCGLDPPSVTVTTEGPVAIGIGRGMTRVTVCRSGERSAPTSQGAWARKARTDPAGIERVMSWPNTYSVIVKSYAMFLVPASARRGSASKLTMPDGAVWTVLILAGGCVWVATCTDKDQKVLKPEEEQ